MCVDIYIYPHTYIHVSVGIYIAEKVCFITVSPLSPVYEGVERCDGCPSTVGCWCRWRWAMCPADPTVPFVLVRPAALGDKTLSVWCVQKGALSHARIQPQSPGSSWLTLTGAEGLQHPGAVLRFLAACLAWSMACTLRAQTLLQPLASRYKTCVALPVLFLFYFYIYCSSLSTYFVLLSLYINILSFTLLNLTFQLNFQAVNPIKIFIGFELDLSRKQYCCNLWMHCGAFRRQLSLCLEREMLNGNWERICKIYFLLLQAFKNLIWKIDCSFSPCVQKTVL